MSSNFLGAPYPITDSPYGYLSSKINNDLNQIKSDLLILLLTNPGERCLAGDTKVLLADGTHSNLRSGSSRWDGSRIAIRDLVNKPPFKVYSFDVSNDRVVVAEATAHKTQKNAPLVEVGECLGGNSARCTENHLWMLRDGSYREAGRLKKGDYLMPLCHSAGDGINFEKPKNTLALIPLVEYVRTVEEREDCYDLSVDTYHNFAISTGSFVHNCMLPNFGTPLNQLLFEPNDAIVVQTATQMITNSINTFEPRITVSQIDVSTTIDPSELNPLDNKTAVPYILSIKISFFDPQNIQAVQTLVLEMPLGT